MSYTIEVSEDNSRRLKVNSSPIHNKGVFVRDKISTGTIIAEYLGKHLSGKDADILENQDYLFILSDEEGASEYIDGNPQKYPENIAGYINHSCSPNLECVFDYTGERVFFVSLRDIKLGEELTYDYWYPHFGEYTPCNCGSESCRGHIEGDPS